MRLCLCTCEFMQVYKSFECRKNLNCGSNKIFCLLINYFPGLSRSISATRFWTKFLGFYQNRCSFSPPITIVALFGFCISIFWLEYFVTAQQFGQSGYCLHQRELPVSSSWDLNYKNCQIGATVSPSINLISTVGRETPNCIITLCI